MATISRLQVYCYGFFLHPPKSQPFHRCRKKKKKKTSPTYFWFYFPPLAGIRFGWRPVSHFCRPLFSPMPFWLLRVMRASGSRCPVWGWRRKLSHDFWSSQTFHRAAAEVSWRHVSTSDRSTMPVRILWFLTRPNIPAGRTWLSTVAIQRVVSVGIEEKPNHFLEPLVMIAFTDKSCIVERRRKWKKRLYTLQVIVCMLYRENSSSTLRNKDSSLAQHTGSSHPSSEYYDMMQP